MALDGDPTGQEIYNEFGANSKPSAPAGAVYGIKEMWEQVFGTGTHSRLDFANTKAAEATTASAINVTDDSATLRGTIDTGAGAGTKSFYFEYGIGDYANSTPVDTQAAEEGGFVTADISSLTVDETYQFRLVAWNGFNSASADRSVGGQQTFETVPDYPTDLNLTQPVATSGTVEATWTNNLSQNIDIEWELDGVQDGIDSLGAVSSAQRTYADGDSIRARVRYNDGSAGPWSPWNGPLLVFIAS